MVRSLSKYQFFKKASLLATGLLFLGSLEYSSIKASADGRNPFQATQSEIALEWADEASRSIENDNTVDSVMSFLPETDFALLTPTFSKETFLSFSLTSPSLVTLSPLNSRAPPQNLVQS